MSEGKQELFAVFAEAENQDKPLIMSHLTFAHLIDDIVVPYEGGEPFFIDGVAVNRDKLKRLKIVRQKGDFDRYFTDVTYYLRSGSLDQQRLYAEKYYIKLDGVFREFGEDVTSQVIKAYDKTIKPSLKDYFPRREELIQAATKVFFESMKLLSGN